MVLDEFNVKQLLQKLILQRNQIKASDDECSSIRNTVIPTLPSALTPGYITLPFLIRELFEHLQLANGRLSLTDASALLSVDRSYIESAAKELCRTENNKNHVELVGENNETSILVTSEYIQNCLIDIELFAQRNGGKISVSDAASHVQMPLSKMLQLLTATDNSTTLILSAQTNKMVILTREYKRRQQRKVRGTFLAITIPTYIDQKFISSALDHDPVLEETLQLAKEMCDSAVLPGELRISSPSSVVVQASSSISYDASSTSAEVPKSTATSSSGDAIYIPKLYVAFQRQTVDQIFRTNGYIKKSELDNLSISKGKMLEFVMQTFVSLLFTSALALHLCLFCLVRGLSNERFYSAHYRAVPISK
jgi:predicted HTH domain antitoxin